MVTGDIDSMYETETENTGRVTYLMMFVEFDNVNVCDIARGATLNDVSFDDTEF